MNPLVSSGSSHHQDTLQIGSKLHTVINIDMEKNYRDHIFCHIVQPYSLASAWYSVN